MKLDKVNKKFRQSKSRLSLTLLFAGTVFAIFLAVILVVGGFGFLLVNAGILDETDIGLVNGNALVLLMILACFVIGAVFAFLFGRYFMLPVNMIINTMNRLAVGDFKARINFKSIIAKNPTIKELMSSINTMASELEKTEMLRSDFVNNFSHEFKTPIVSIAGFAKLLKTEKLSDKERLEYLNIIEEESLRLSDMATNVLSLTKIENQTILTDVSRINISELIRTCFLLLEAKWSNKEIDFKLDFDEYFLNANEELLRQVFINLLDNAIKFTPQKGVVSVTIVEDGRFTKIQVANTGSHINDGDKEKIFNKFYQADKSHSTAGNGIGLAVAKRIVELHSGAIDVNSQNGITVFEVSLPNTN